MAAYLDTSAAVKLVVAEAGSKALLRWLQSRDEEIVSSDLLRTELLRVTRRSAPDQMVRARTVLDSLTLLKLTTGVCERAATLEPTMQRSLDALHIAAALELGDELSALVSYDERMAEGAGVLGIPVLAPR